MAIRFTLRYQLLLIAIFSVACFVLAADTVFAQEVLPGPGDVAEAPDGPNVIGANLWLLLVVGPAIRFVMYAINHRLPFLDTEPKKQVAAALVAALGGALYQLIFDGNLGLNDATFNAVGQALLGALAAHNLLFKPGGINWAMGGGTNADGSVTDPNSTAWHNRRAR